MKVAILGCPGSGKTKLARKLSRRINAELPERWRGWTVVDGYVEKLRARTGLPFGVQSDYEDNFAVISDRWVREQEALHKGLHTITCGTIYETIIYCTPRTMHDMLTTDERTRVAEYVVAETLLGAIGTLASSTFDYDCLFYIPAKVEDQHSWESVINAKIPEVLEGFNLYAVPLTGTLTRKVDRAIAVIQGVQEAVEAALASDEQRGSSDGDGDSPDDEHQPGDLSDLSEPEDGSEPGVLEVGSVPPADGDLDLKSVHPLWGAARL